MTGKKLFYGFVFTLMLLATIMSASANELTDYSYDNINLSTQDTIPTGMFFNSDGTKLYEIGYDSDLIYQYSCTSAWDLSTCSYDSVSLSTQDTIPNGMFFNSDGTKLYEIGYGSDLIYQYSCTSAWDLSTCSYDSVSLSAQDANPTDVFFNSDGTKLYEIGYNSDLIYQYSCTSAWDLSTCSYDSVSLSTQDTIPNGMFFNSDGTKLYEIGYDSDLIYQYSCTSAWDLSTCSYDDINISTQDSLPTGMFFSSSGTKLYEIGAGSDLIYQYSTDYVDYPLIYLQNAYDDSYLNFNVSTNNSTWIEGNTSGLEVDYLDIWNLNPQMFLSFNKHNNFLKDYSTNNITITNDGTSTTSEDCSYLNCLDIPEGNKIYITDADGNDLDIGTSDFSMFWCGKNPKTDQGMVWQHGAGSASMVGHRLYWTGNGGVIIQITDGTTLHSCTNYATDINEGNQYCWLAEFDRDSKVQLYRNGTSVYNCTTISGADGIDISSNQPFFIGSAGASVYYNGTIDEFYLIKNILTTEQKNALFNLNKTTENLYFKSNGYSNLFYTNINLNETFTGQTYQSILSPIVTEYGSGESISSFNMTINGKVWDTIAYLNEGNYTIEVSSGTLYPKNFTYEIIAGTTNTPSWELYGNYNLTLNFKDDQTGNAINNVHFELVSDLQADNYTATTGTYNLNIKGVDDYRVSYYATGYDEKTYYFTADETPINLTLYLTNSTDLSNITATVIDTYGNSVEGARIRVLKYDLDSNSYILTEISETNHEGQTILHLIKNTQYYKFHIYYNDELVLETSPTKIYQDTISFEIQTDDSSLSDDYFTLSDLDFELVFNEETNNFRYTFADSSATASQGCLKVWRVTALGTSDINESCVDSASGTILIGVTNTSGATYRANAYITISNTEYLVSTISHMFDPRTSIGNAGVFGVILLTMTIVFVGFWNPIVMLILSPLPLLLGVMVGLINLTIWWAIPIYVVAIILIFVLNKKG